VEEELAPIFDNATRRVGAKIEEMKKPLNLDTMLKDICYHKFCGISVDFMTLSWGVTCCHDGCGWLATRSHLRLVVPIPGEKQLDQFDLTS
jgi:hypothetical protein